MNTGAIKKREPSQSIQNWSKKEILQGLHEIVLKECKIPENQLKPEATLESLGMFSMDIILILTGIEEKFSVYIPIDDSLIQAKTLDDFFAVILKIIENSFCQQEVPKEDREGNARMQPFEAVE